MKRLLSLLLALTLLLTGGCGSIGSLRENATQSASGEPAQTSTAFSLASLPDIGRYEGKQVKCFYDAPLDEFKTANNYGGLLPYKMTSDQNISAYGFITADGRIVTAPVYSALFPITMGDSWLYLATQRQYVFTPGAKADRNADDDGYFAEALPEQQKLLIRSDGSAFLTLPGDGDPEVFTDNAAGESVIVFCETEYEELDEETWRSTETYTFYDADLNPLPDMTAVIVSDSYTQLLELNGGAVLFAESTGEYNEATDEYEQQTTLISFKNGKSQKTVTVDDSINSVVGDMLIGSSGIYDRDGKLLRALPEEAACSGEIFPGCCFISDPEEKTLTRMKDGKAEKSIPLTPTAASYVAMETGNLDGKDCLVVIRDPYDEEYSEILCYDADLNLLHGFLQDGEQNNYRALYDYRNRSGPGYCYVMANRNATADIYSLNGALLASLPYDDENDWLDTGDGCVYNSTVQEKNLICFTEDGEVREYAFSCPGTDAIIQDVTGTLVTVRYDWQNVDYSMWRRNSSWYRIYDANTGSLLYDDLEALEWMSLENGSCFVFTRGGTAYVCDGELNVIAAIPDGYYA